MTAKTWTPGTGPLGALEPLLGQFAAEGKSANGQFQCMRSFEKTLGGQYVRLYAAWEFGGVLAYEETAIFGTDEESGIVYWSFTSDGKRSAGKSADVSDIHPEAVGFEAQMPAGLARQAYYPGEAGSYHWVVESKEESGWSRFVAHHYVPVDSASTS